MKHLLVIAIIIFLVCLAIGCSTPAERILTKVNDDYNFKGMNCRKIAQQKVLALEIMGIEAKVVHCEARDKYSWDHAAVKATLDGQEWLLDNGRILDVVWKYDEIKKSCYDFYLP